MDLRSRLYEPEYICSMDISPGLHLPVQPEKPKIAARHSGVFMDEC